MYLTTGDQLTEDQLTTGLSLHFRVVNGSNGLRYMPNETTVGPIDQKGQLTFVSKPRFSHLLFYIL